ncbi:hypothetical protein [Actinoplanes sp. GCM10030250]|uniref:hypothetical protein n=1 Tax=Actinoplanes sp. GCM10030250 TaxID=3273376 RepID=UPI0036193ED6
MPGSVVGLAASLLPGLTIGAAPIVPGFGAAAWRGSVTWVPAGADAAGAAWRGAESVVPPTVPLVVPLVVAPVVALVVAPVAPPASPPIGVAGAVVGVWAVRPDAVGLVWYADLPSAELALSPEAVEPALLAGFAPWAGVEARVS